MSFPTDISEMYGLTLDAGHIQVPPDPKIWATFTQELCEIVAESWPGELCSASCDVTAGAILLVFKHREPAEKFKHDWYMVRAKLIARAARDFFTTDPDDIPF